jgi:hypothetical protein
MRDINSGTIIFNLSGGAILITVFAYMGFAFFHTDTVAPCTARYPAGMQFALDSQGGNLLTPIELQGRAGSREWGILKNAQILGSAAGSNDAVMRVSLASTDGDDETARNGVGFTWQSAGLAKATSACLSYRVFLPTSFAFTEPGYLPGLYASDLTELDAKTPMDGFVARVGWAQGGGTGVEVRSVGGTSWQAATEPEPWPLGRWVPVEQEIALSSKGAGDGTLRLWIDGKLRIENRSLALKSDSNPGISGVVADIGYARTPVDTATLKVSPFVVQWQ